MVSPRAVSLSCDLQLLHGLPIVLHSFRKTRLGRVAVRPPSGQTSAAGSPTSLCELGGDKLVVGGVEDASTLD